MKPIVHILNHEEKKILENHFWLQKHNSLQNFTAWRSSLVKQYGNCTRKQHALQDEIILMWDVQKENTALHHLVDSPKFNWSNNHARQFKFFSRNFHPLNSLGQTPLMLLARYDANYPVIALLVKDHPHSSYIHDKEGQTYHEYFLSHFNPYAKSRGIHLAFTTLMSTIETFLYVGMDILQQKFVDKSNMLYLLSEKSRQLQEVLRDNPVDENTTHRGLYGRLDMREYLRQLESIETYVNIHLATPVDESKGKKRCKI